MAAGIEAPTEQVFDNLAAVLGEAGTSLDHVVKAKGLAGRQAGFGEVALNAAPGALGDLVLGQGGEEAGGGPAFLVGAFGEARPDVLDRRQAQIAQQQAEPRGVDGIGCAHAAARSVEAPAVSAS